MNYSDGDYINGISVSNLHALFESNRISFEKRICELADLARDASISASALMADGQTLLEAILLMSERSLPSADIPEDIHPDLLKFSRVFSESMDVFDRIIFSVIFSDRLSGMGTVVDEGSFLPSSSKDAVLTYVKTPLSDEAYDVFSQELRDPRVAYAKDLSQASHAVFDGVAGYCILPLEESGDYRLSVTEELLYSKDLKILAVTPVFGFEGSADMKYALVASDFDIPPINGDDDRYLEILLPLSGNNDVSQIVTACSVCGIEVYRMSTVCYGEDEERERFLSLILRRCGRDFSDILSYLVWFCPDFTPRGLYLNLE